MHYGPNNRDAIEEKLHQMIEKPEKQPDENELFCLSLATSLRKIQDPQNKEYTKLQLQQTMSNSSQIHVWLTAQCRLDSASASTSSYAYVPPSTKLQLQCK